MADPNESQLQVKAEPANEARGTLPALKATTSKTLAAWPFRNILWPTALGCATVLVVIALWRLPSIIVDDGRAAKTVHITDHSFEIAKIVLDKGLLALLLAALGFAFSWSIERLKADLTRRNDEAKDDRAKASEMLKEQRDALLDQQRDERKTSAEEQRRERENVFDERRRDRDRAEQAAKIEIDRTYVPRTQFDITCRFYGPMGDRIIAAIELIAENKGGSVRAFEKMTYRVLSMFDDAEPRLRRSEDGIRRVEFGGDHIKEQTAEGRTFSVEPGIRQVFPLTTLIDARSRFVLVKVQMDTHAQGQPGATWLAEERFFPVVLERGPGN